MKKILIIHPALVIGGAESVLLSYLRILGKYADRYQIELVLMEDRQNHRINEIPPSIKISHLLTGIESAFFIYAGNHRNDPVEGHYFNSWYIGCQEKINRLLLEKINTENYDLIIDFQNNSSKFEYFLNKFDVNIPIIRWVHGDIFLSFWENQPEYFSRILNKYHTIVSIADEMKERIQYVFNNKLNISNKVDLCRIYNPVDAAQIKQRSLQSEENDNNLLKEDFILHVSRLEENKNALELVDIYHQLKKKGIKEKLYIIGKGFQFEKIRNRIKELNLENDCFLLGERANPFPFMKKAKLFLFSSIGGEGLGMVLIESMVCGTPTVAYQCLVGPKDVLADGKYGALIPVGDRAQFAEKTFELLTDENKYQHYVNLLPEAVKRFESETIESQLIELIESVMKKA